MVAFWSVEPVDDWATAGIENQGQHSHDWLRHQSRERTWLFKPARPSRDRSVREDIAEKLGCEFARLLGVPAARVELADRDHAPGALVEDARLPDWELQLGQVLMPEVVADYEPNDAEHIGYNVENIRRALERFTAPPEATTLPAGFNAFDTFTGYLIFDALIAHGDRHDRNWAVLVPPPGGPGRDALCPSFDHAASLGFTLTDEKRGELLAGANGTIAGWALRGRARRFEHRAGTRWQTLVDLAGAAAALCPSETRDFWRDRIMSVECDSVDDVVAAAPDLSDVARRFTVELVMVNRGRLLDVLS
ncbi:hypothetical protein [Mycolicibacterium sp. HK-90]|uniref:hypothetical protein n=1 Tax=Mycolicibacterium sp. HK-90 TaxID=3056937 RepID=UPI00265A5A23|nr:hypothetical protein [Mycolicibacterium sp. HK-90]WKG04201.1 hypothetical protein QU592_03530 [Mycolicibacterium sp. HK-90]